MGSVSILNVFVGGLKGTWLAQGKSGAEIGSALWLKALDSCGTLSF